MNVTTTGRPRYDASENGAPFWSTSEISGARSLPAAQVAAGWSDTGAAELLLVALVPCDDVPTKNRAIAAATPISSTTPQKRPRAPSRWAVGADGGVADTLPEDIPPPASRPAATRCVLEPDVPLAWP